MYHKQKFLNGLGLMKRAGVLVYGDDLLPSITKRSVACVVIASDASERTKKQLLDKCTTYKIDAIVFPTRDELSQAIGMNNRVAVGISDRRMVKVLKNCKIEEVNDSYE